MNVLHVYSGNLYGGIETLLVTLARNRALCPDMQLEVALCFDGRLASALADAGICVHRLPEARASRPHTIRAARRRLADLCESGRFDRIIIHAAWSQALFGGVAKRAGVPLVYWAHDASTGKHWTERIARRVRPTLAIANSRYTAGSLSNLYRDVPTAVLSYPVEMAQTRLTASERASIRHSLNTAPEATVLVQVSRMEAWKGHVNTIDALGRMRTSAAANWVWWVVGGAQRPEEAAYLDGLVAAARGAGIGDRVRWLGERRDVDRILAAADLYCQVNAAPEPFGIAYIEALAAGLPVIAARAGGVMEIVDASCGTLIVPGDRAALTSAIEELIGNSDARSRLAAQAPARARTLCAPEAQIRRLGETLTCMAPIGAAA
jgi:glycosyltransferase involved in cell wall biosynthesis